MNNKNILIAIVLLFFCSCNQQNTKYKVHDNNIIVEKYSKGKMIERVTYLGDTLIKEGEAIYYKDGKVKRAEYWHDNNLTGSYWEYMDSNSILYICYDSYGDTIFSRRIKRDGTFDDYGNMLPHGTLDIEDIMKDSSVRYASFIVRPPKVGIKWVSYLINLDNRDTIWPYNTSTIYDWITYSDFKIIQHGNYKHRQEVYLIDTLKDGLKLRVTDTTIFSW